MTKKETIQDIAIYMEHNVKNLPDTPERQTARANADYFIVTALAGVTCILQMGKELNWFFHDNRAKCFKTLKTAIKDAYALDGRYSTWDRTRQKFVPRLRNVRVWAMRKTDRICVDTFNNFGRRNDFDRLMFEIDNNQ